MSYQSVACPSASTCVSLADSSPGYGPPVLIAVTRTAGAQTTTRLPMPSLSTDPSGVRYARPTAISCPTTDFCGAIAEAGTVARVTVPIALVYTGGAWTARELRPPSPTTSLSMTSISCPAPGVCVAVGGYRLESSSASANLVETLSGGTWTPRRLPNAASGDNTLSAVSCAMTGSCVAVGQAGDGLAVLRLKAGTWSPTGLPVPAGFLYGNLPALSCAASQMCTAVGEFTDHHSRTGPFAVQLTSAGATATALPSVADDPPHLTSLDCATTSHCVAVGQSFSQRYAETLNKGTWSLATISAESPDGYTVELNGVSCPSTSSCVAVGHHRGRALVATLAAARWSVAETVSAGPSYANVDALSCPDDQHCLAIGTTLDKTFKDRAITETRAGATWTAASLNFPSPADLTLTGISCPAPGACVITGLDTATQHPVAATQSGSSWTLSPLPLPAGAGRIITISAPSCAVTGRCVVVLSYSSSGLPSTHQLAETLSNGTWSFAELPLPPDPDANRGGYPAAVSCASPTWCAFVGVYQRDTPGEDLYAGILDKGTWTATALTPTDEILGNLVSISCPAPGACAAVGTNGSGQSVKPLQVTLRAGTWSGGSLPIPAGVRNQLLTSVSCPTAARCVAVGLQTLAEGATNPLVDTMSSGTWTTTVLANPPGGQLGQLSSVSCWATACDAVGSARTGDGGHKPFSATLPLPTG